MPVFSSLSDRLQDTFDKLRGKGRLTEDDINVAMREIRLALLEADVNYRVVRSFVQRCREQCLEAEVLSSLNPTQNVVRIVLNELQALLGSEDVELTLDPARKPNVIMLVGLQGSGKTTAASKLAYLLKGKDLIPDDIPVVGYADDLAVFAAAFLIDEPELSAYAQWRAENGKAEESI